MLSHFRPSTAAKRSRKKALNNRAKPVCFHTTSISASLFPMSAFVSFSSAPHALSITQHLMVQPKHHTVPKFDSYFILFPRSHRMQVYFVCRLQSPCRFSTFYLFWNFSINFFFLLHRSRLVHRVPYAHSDWVASDVIIIKVVNSHQVTYLPDFFYSRHHMQMKLGKNGAVTKSLLDQKLITRNSNSFRFAFN